MRFNWEGIAGYYLAFDPRDGWAFLRARCKFINFYCFFTAEILHAQHINVTLFTQILYKTSLNVLGQAIKAYKYDIYTVYCYLEYFIRLDSRFLTRLLNEDVYLMRLTNFWFLRSEERFNTIDLLLRYCWLKFFVSIGPPYFLEYVHDFLIRKLDYEIPTTSLICLEMKFLLVNFPNLMTFFWR